MAEKGYIYALINPSLSGLIKVGKTTKEPEYRAKELSSGTAVPTPFKVAYKIYVNDCSAAESFLHTLLEVKGYRINDNREFFNAPLNEMIESILKAQEKFGTMNYQINEPCKEEFEFEHKSYGDDFLDSLTIKDDPPYKEIIEQADAFYYGHGDVLQDYSEALRLYIKSAKLGAIEVYPIIGTMYIMGEGCHKSYETALKYLKEGAAKENSVCYGVMGEMCVIQRHTANAIKCYKKYFESDAFRNNTYRCGNNVYTGRKYIAQNYLTFVDLKQLPLDNLPYLTSIKDEILGDNQEMIGHCREENDNEALQSFIRRRQLLMKIFPNIP